MFKIKALTKEIDALAKRIKKKSTDFSPVTRQIAGIMLDAVEENFEKEGRPVKWSPLAPSTIKQREKKGKLGKILQVSGQLAASIQPSNTNTTATVSTNQFHAAIHHFGGRTGKGRKTVIPARPFMVIPKPDQDELEDVLSVFLDNL